MALTKSGSARTVQASATNAAGATTTTSWLAINCGVSGIALVSNGGTGPDPECQVRAEFSADGSTAAAGYVLLGGGGRSANAATPVPYTFAPAGAGGDWAYYRLVFTGNAGQPVTVQASDSTTTSLV